MILLRRSFLLAVTAAAALAPSAFAQAGSLPVGGRNGRIIRVTTLKSDGPGSITEAIKATGPRIVVFEVGGVIDLAKTGLRITKGDLTIAGQTPPAPGITFIRGGIEISQNTRSVVINHIAVRPGEAGAAKKSGWECDGIYAYGASDILVANCSVSWATDEGLSASGKRFGIDNAGIKVAEWREATSHNIHFTRNIVAEGLSNSTHSKGEHSKGTLIHDNVRDAHISESLYAHNMERNILFKGGAQGVMTRCVVYNAGKRFAHYNLHANEWEGRNYVEGNVEILNNAFLAGPSTDGKAAAFMLGGEGPLVLTMMGNLAIDKTGARIARLGRFGTGEPEFRDLNAIDDRTQPTRAAMQPMIDRVLANCGARPWDRDPIDARIVADVRKGTGRIIDSEQDVGGYPVRAETHAPFVEAQWNLDTLERR